MELLAKGSVVKDGLKSLVNGQIVYKGVNITPREHKQTTYALL
jgi:hypothetical protein